MKSKALQSPISNVVLILAMLVSSFASLRPTAAVKADHTANPSSVALVGSLQDELGCSGEWQPDCAASYLSYDSNDDVWQRSWSVPAGSYDYKTALNNGWDENYGANAVPGGGNIALTADGSSVKFYYDHKSHWITSNKNSVIAVAPGSFQSELGCPGDWSPDCLRSWLQDPDGDGTYVFETTAIPPGSYAGKVALDESWDVNYGAGGVQNGPDILFTVNGAGDQVTFSYDSTSHILSINVVSSLPQHDNNVEWDGLRHDSRDTLYRTPGGAVEAGTPVTVRFRTFHNDVTGVTLRVYSLNANAQLFYPMTLAASDVSCYQTGLENAGCDFWTVTLPNADPDNLWYRFFITDGTDIDYYDDNTAALDGGPGATTEDVEDNSFALMVYEPGFTSPTWARDAVIYQIFPDRFRDGRANNNPHTGDIRYDDPVLKLDWGILPEGYCRNYADGATNCPWRFDATPPSSSPNKEQPRGRDYYGGDLKGVDQQLDYLQSLGVNTIYFNPIFDAGSNHSYDTQNYMKIDPYFGTQKDWENLVKHADQRGIRIVLDGVFNHLSSDSPFFDRYHHYSTVGACESASSPYRSWFHFRAPAGNEPSVCAPSTPGGNDTYYDGWFGFDSIPVIDKTEPEVQAYFLTDPNSVAKHWLNAGAGGWRMDVSGDPSFPAGYWEEFRDVTKTTEPDALLISETWQKDSTLLRMIRGDRLDTTMNYRLRDAVIGLLAPGPFDSKGFADSGQIIEPSEFAARIESMREDYPDAAYYSLMNLLDSHDTERLLWTLTPGAETRAEKELNAANLSAGKRNVELASLIQFTMPGAPTVYYGDEVGITGDDDPDDRRTYPWSDLGGSPDTDLFGHYQTLAALRDANAALTEGDIRILLADDATDVVAYGRKLANDAVVVVINRNADSQLASIPVAGYLPDGTSLNNVYSVGVSGPSSVTVENGHINGTIGAKSAWILVTNNADLTPPAAPQGLSVTNEGNGEVSLEWGAVAGAASYNLYRSPLTGGGFDKVDTGPLDGTSYTDTGLRNAQPYFYVVTALDTIGNESAHSNEVSATPRLSIGWANLQWPPSMTHTISVTDRTDNVYGQVWIDGVTDQPGPAPSLRAQLGFGPDGSDPADNPDWIWVEASFNTNVGNNDEFVASMLPETTGTFDYAYRYSTTNGTEWVYADLDGIGNGYSLDQAGSLTVNTSGDTTAPAVPTGLHVVASSPVGIELSWDAVAGDPTLYGYDVLRSDADGGPYTAIATVTSTSYTDTDVVQNGVYYYVVRAVDTSLNRSGNSDQVDATAEARTVTVVFTVTVPASTDSTGRVVHIAGTLDRLDGGLAPWDPAAVALTRVDATTWTIELTGTEGTQIEYKYALGSWDFVEKDGGCGEIGNRMLTLSYGTTGTQQVNNTVLNWRNVSPCGN